MKRPLDHMDGDPRGKSEGFTTNLGENVLFKSASFFFKNSQGHHILCCCTKIKIIYVKCPSSCPEKEKNVLGGQGGP